MGIDILVSEWTIANFVKDIENTDEYYEWICNLPKDYIIENMPELVESILNRENWNLEINDSWISFFVDNSDLLIEN